MLTYYSVSNGNMKSLKLLGKYYEKMETGIKLSTLTVFSRLGLSMNTSVLIQAEIDETNKLSNELYDLDVDAFGSTLG